MIVSMLAGHSVMLSKVGGAGRISTPDGLSYHTGITTVIFVVVVLAFIKLF